MSNVWGRRLIPLLYVSGRPEMVVCPCRGARQCGDNNSAMKIAGRIIPGDDAACTILSGEVRPVIGKPVLPAVPASTKWFFRPLM